MPIIFQRYSVNSTVAIDFPYTKCYLYNEKKQGHIRRREDDDVRSAYEQVQRQEQRITSSLIQGLKMLSLPAQGMYDYLVELSMGNPMLEIPEPPTYSAFDTLSAAGVTAMERGYDPAYYGAESGVAAAEPEDFDPYYSRGVAFEADGLVGSLKLQLAVCRLSPVENAIGLDIIGNLDDSGYFVGDLETICLLYCQPIEVGRRVLETVQGFQPRGIAARNVYEALCLQVEDSFPEAELARRIIREDLRAVCDGATAERARHYGVTAEQLTRAFDYIRTLEPRPGNCDERPLQIQYTQPDIEVRRRGTELLVTVAGENDNPLQLSDYYLDLLHRPELSSEDRQYLRGCLNNARALIHSVDIRRQTMHRAALSLVSLQGDFFRHGPDALRPLTMQQLADEMGVNVSTVCRVVQDKYIATPYGIYPMKYFFARALRGENDQLLTAEAARRQIEKLIEGEQPDAPFTDDEICARLGTMGYRLSRRTVSKYRQAAGIPSFVKRKREG